MTRRHNPFLTAWTSAPRRAKLVQVNSANPSIVVRVRMRRTAFQAIAKAAAAVRCVSPSTFMKDASTAKACEVNAAKDRDEKRRAPGFRRV